ncbi:hypothetical protein HDV05_006777, partial [Chytridiales sp. JEL 0842]
PSEELNVGRPQSSLSFVEESQIYNPPSENLNVGRQSIDTPQHEPHTAASVESLAWGYLQMTGHFSVDPSYVKSSQLETLKNRVMYRVGGGASSGGGGSMGFAPSEVNGTNSKEKTYPLYNTPPSILFADLYLERGKSKTFKYEIVLPKELPPSHRGKIIRFSYRIIVGVQRFGIESKSQMFQIPFRILTNADSAIPNPFSLLEPIIINVDNATVTDVKEEGATSQRIDSTTIEDDDDEPTILQKLIMICQRSRRVSFQISKNDESVAFLNLARNSFRLGETMEGVLDFTNGTLPCYQVSVFLEHSEVVDSDFANKSQSAIAKATKRVFAEQHLYVINTRKIGISLQLPIGSTPDFKTDVVSLEWVVRIEFIIGRSKQLMRDFESDIHFNHSGVLDHVDVEAFDCCIPLKVYPTELAKKPWSSTFQIL